MDDPFWKEQRLAAAATLANEILPPMLALGIGIIGAKPETSELRLSNAGIRDEHLGPLIECLFHSECALHELDLAFNELTDHGVEVLCEALTRKLSTADWHACAFELTHIFIGGNAVSPAAIDALTANLKRAGRDVEVDASPRLRKPMPLCKAVAVFDGSPAASAGMLKGDVIVAFASLHNPKQPEKAFRSNPQRQYDAVTYFVDVAFSMGPIVKASLGKPISVVVERKAAAVPDATNGPGDPLYVKLALVPQKWEGQGVTGCKLVEVPSEEKKGKTK